MASSAPYLARTTLPPRARKSPACALVAATEIWRQSRVAVLSRRGYARCEVCAGARSTQIPHKQALGQQQEIERELACELYARAIAHRLPRCCRCCAVWEARRRGAL